jgi:hypothetical protein
MSQSSTLFIGMEVHKESMAVAYVAQDPGAQVPSRGPIGTCPCDIDPLLRKRPATAPHVRGIYAASPWGSWRYRYCTTPGSVCWVGAPSRRPKTAGDRVTTDRRDAVPLARLARSGELTGVYVPTGEDAASRALRRTRDDARGDLQDAPCRLTAF